MGITTNSMTVNKVSLSAYDDKRYLHDNGISSYAHGHYRIQNNKQGLILHKEAQ